MKRQTTLSFALVFSIAALLAYAIISLAGAFLLWAGNLLLSLSVVLAGAGFMLLLVIALQKFKQARIDIPLARRSEFVAAFLYIITTLLAVFLFAHYFNVAERKGDINQKWQANIDKVSKMIPTYKDTAKRRMEIYSLQLDAIIARKDSDEPAYFEAGFTKDLPDEQQKGILLKAFYEEGLLAGVDDLNTTIQIQLNKIRRIDLCNPYFIFSNIQTIKTDYRQWESILQTKSKSKKEALTPFNYPISFNTISNLLVYPSPPKSLKIWVYWFILNFIILLPYWVSKRGRRF